MKTAVEPKTLTSAEVELLDRYAAKIYAEQPWNGEDARGAYEGGLRLIEARRELLASPPAPVASELPEAVADAIDAITDAYNETDDGYGCAAALEAWARKQEQEHRFQVRTLEAKYDNERVLRERDERSLSTASAGLPKVRALVDRARQAARHLCPSFPEWSELLLRDSDAALAELDAAQAVGMTPELERVLEFAADRHKDANTDTRVLWVPDYLVDVRKAIDAVRAQAAKAQAAAMTNAEIKELVKLSVWAATASLPNDTLARLDSLREKLLATEPAEREGGK